MYSTHMYSLTHEKCVFFLSMSIEAHLQNKGGEEKPARICNVQNGHLYMQMSLFVSLSWIYGIAHDSTVK